MITITVSFKPNGSNAEVISQVVKLLAGIDPIHHSASTSEVIETGITVETIKKVKKAHKPLTEEQKAIVRARFAEGKKKAAIARGEKDEARYGLNKGGRNDKTKKSLTKRMGPAASAEVLGKSAFKDEEVESGILIETIDPNGKHSFKRVAPVGLTPGKDDVKIKAALKKQQDKAKLIHAGNITEDPERTIARLRLKVREPLSKKQKANLRARVAQNKKEAQKHQEEIATEKNQDEIAAGLQSR